MSSSQSESQQLGIGSPEPIAALNRVKILEHTRVWQEREPLVDIRVYCPGVVCNEGICPYLRQRVADMLNRAQAALPLGYRLKVGTALRTLAMQQRGWNNYFKRMQEEHPLWPLSALRRATNKYHAPYDQKAPPGHCTGGAVDVGLLDPAGNALDMVAPTQGWDAVDTFSNKISPEARANRMLMVEAMLGAGFSNCRDEYWHYSYGDSAWAVRLGERECPYGWVWPPVTLDTRMEDTPASSLEMETIRDRNGRPLAASGSCTWPAEEKSEERSEANLEESFRMGLLWARDVHLTLRLQSGTASLSPPPSFYIGDGKETWETLPSYDVQRDNDTLILHLTPTLDRAVLTTQKPAPPEVSAF